MRVTVDASELHALVRDFGESPAKFARGAKGVMSKAGVNIKREMKSQARASGIPEAADLARYITYDLDGLDLVVGPRTGAAGSFGFLYYGNSKNGPVLPDPVHILNDEAGNVERYVADVAEDVL